jgi:hypothetical protein
MTRSIDASARPVESVAGPGDKDGPAQFVPRNRPRSMRFISFVIVNHRLDTEIRAKFELI